MMKNILSKLNRGGGLLALLLAGVVATAYFWIVPWAKAQVVAMGNGAPCQGTTNGPVVATLNTTFQVKQLSVTVSGGTNEASVFIGNIYASLNGSTNGAYLLGSITNAVGTGTFSTNVPAFQVSIPVTYFVQSATLTNTLNEGMIYGP